MPDLKPIISSPQELKDYITLHPDATIQQLMALLDPETAARQEALEQELGAVTPKMAYILHAMGAASVCWKEEALLRAGEFDSRLAAQVAKELYQKLGLTG